MINLSSQKAQWMTFLLKGVLDFSRFTVQWHAFKLTAKIQGDLQQLSVHWGTLSIYKSNKGKPGMILASYTIHSKKKDKAEKPVVQVRTAFMGAKDI